MKKVMRESLALKWMVFSVLLATIPLAIAGFSIIQIYQRDLNKSVIELEETKANIVVERTEAFFEKIISTFTALTHDEHFKKGSSFEHKRNHLETLLYRNDYLVELAFLNEKGREIIKVSKYRVIGPKDLKDRSKDEVFRVTSGGKIYYGHFKLTEDVVPTIEIAIPLEEHSWKYSAIIYAEIHLRYLWNLIPQTQIGKRGSTYVIDKRGDLIAHPDTRRVLLRENMRDLPMVDQVISGKEGNLEFKQPEGEKFLVVYKPIKKLGWGVIVQVPRDEAYEPITKIAHTAIKWVFFALAIAVALSLFFTRKFISPIKNLSKEMKDVAKGNLHVYIQSTAKDEFGDLTESFNQMIQDLKQSQEILKEAEEKFRKIFEGSKDMVFITSYGGKFIDVNEAGAEMLGYTRKEELMEVNVRDLYVHPGGREKFREEVAKKGFVKDFEIQLKKKDGAPIDCLITATARKDGEGNIIGYEGFVKDISDRKKMEEELLQRKEELQTLYDVSVLINQTLDLEKIFPIALERALSLTGFEMGTIHLLSNDGEILELKFSKGVSPTLEENIKTFQLGEGVCGRTVQLKRPIVLSIDEYPTPRVIPFLRKEGFQISVGIPLLAKGNAIGAITMASRSLHHLTQREINLLESIGNQIGLALENAKLFSNVVKAKSEWEITFDAVTDLITIIYKDYRILRANKAAFKRYGLDPKKVIGRKCYEIFNNLEPCEGCGVQETFRTKKPASGEIESKYLKGVFQYYTFPIFNEFGEIIAVVELSREITEQKRLDREKEVVNSINKILASNLDVRRVIKGVHSELKKVLDSERMTITLSDREGDEFRYFALEKDYEAQELLSSVNYPKEGTPFANALETGLPVIVSDTAESYSWVNQKLFKEGIRSSLVFPLEYKGKIIGTMNFGSRKIGHFSEDHVRFLHQVAAGLAISIQNALLFEEIKKKLDEFTILYEITRISTSSLILDQMLTEIVNSLHNFFKFEAFGILLMNENTKRLLPHPSYKGHPIENLERLELCLGKGITGWVAEKGEGLLVNDVRKDPRYVSGDGEILSEMCVPLKVGQKIIGVIDAQSGKLDAFSEDDFRMLNIAGGQLATLIENVRLYEEIRASEEKYRTVVESAHDGVGVLGDDYKFKYVNERLAEITGYSQEKLIGMDFRNLLDEKSKEWMSDRYIRRQRGEEVPSRYEFSLLRKDGEKRDIEISSTIVKDSRGNVNTIAFVKDVTEKRKMEEQLLQSEKLRALGEMASGVAHDFNNALAAILGNTQLHLYTVKDEEVKEALQTIEKVTKDAAQTVRRLQDFTRRKVHQDLFKVDVNSIVNDAIEITKPKWKDDAQRKGIHIAMIAKFEEVPPVTGSASELIEIITNMVFNAIEAMPEGGKIEIRTFQKKEKIYIQISDTGIGMTEEVRRKIFEPFFTTKPFSHTGLGLSMSYGIIKRLEGEIDIESSIGKGTTFTISLPVGLEGKEEAVDPSLMIKEGKEAKILVIDDEENVRNVLSRILSQVNHQVTVADNGERGIQLFKEKEFDIVLTDLGMPGMSGWEVCKAIKEMRPRTPVGMITGWRAEIDQMKITENKLDFLISKPFDFKQIIKVVNEAIKSKGKQLVT